MSSKKSTCYLCNTPTRFFLAKGGYELYRCPSCRLTNTLLTTPYNTFVKTFYSGGYFTGDPSRGAYSNYAADRPYITRTMGKFLSEIQSTRPPPARLLDVGCAYGYFVQMAQSAGYDAYGIDPSPHAVARAKLRLDGRVREETIGSAAFAGKRFDVITMLDVLEHLSDPRSDLRKAARLLTPEGMILIATGNTGSIAAKLLGRRWTFYIPPQHLFFFNRENLARLLDECGLTPVHWFGVGKWLALQYVLHLARTSGESSLARFLYPFIASNPVGRIPLYLPMGDNMVVIARKKP